MHCINALLLTIACATCIIHLLSGFNLLDNDLFSNLTISEVDNLYMKNVSHEKWNIIIIHKAQR